MKEKEINIIALEFPYNIITRPGMFIGSTDKPDVILREAVDNSIDELMGSVKCNKLDIQLKAGTDSTWYIVSDNGRGIPIILDEDKSITKTELAVGTVNAGSKFTSDDISVGLNGVGISACNALSDKFLMLSKITGDNYDKSIPSVKDLWNNTKDVDINQPFYYIYYECGIKKDEGSDLKVNIESKFGITYPNGMSTVTAFVPSPSIWKSCDASYNKRSLSYVGIILKKFYNKDCEVTINGKLANENFIPYRYEYVTDVVKTDGEKTRQAKFYINFDVDKDLSIQDLSGSINSLIVDRGIHIDWARRAYSEALKLQYGIQHDYLLAGLKLNIICLTGNTDFSSQTKERCVKIDNLYVDEILPYLTKEFRKVFSDNNNYFLNHVARLNEYAESLTKISAINKVKAVVGTVDGGNRVRSKLPSSVRDAASNDRSKCDLYICEGKSAGGTLIKARNPEYVAVLGLRGIPLNSVNLDLDAIMDNEEMCGIVTAIGAGVNEYFKLENCRYGKIVLAADSDADGCKINSMLLGFIARKMTFLLSDGRVFIALAPLYQQGNKLVYPGEDPKSILDMSKSYKRYKGLGEINVAEAKEFFFNEDTRRFIKVTVENLPYVFELLTSTSARKDLMMENKVIIDKYNTGII